MRIGYFADGVWGQRALSLISQEKSLEIGFVVLRQQQPDNELAAMAARLNIEVLSAPDVNSTSFMTQLLAFDCDVLVSMSFDQIFRAPLIASSPLGILNCHAGQLPWYRGRNVLNWVLINDEPSFGVTVHDVDEGIDTGDIILQRTYPISDSDNYATLIDRAGTYCAETLLEALLQVSTGKDQRVPQAHIDSKGFYCSGRRPGDERLNWAQTSREVFSFVRALCNPGPGAITFSEDTPVVIEHAEFLAGVKPHGGFPGAIVGLDNTSFLVKTLDTYIRVTQWHGDFTPRIGVRFT